MAGERRKKGAEIEDRRRQVAALYLAHVHQADIAAQLGVAQSTVSADLAAIKERWRSQALADVQDRVAQELVELEEMEAYAIAKLSETGLARWASVRLEIKTHRERLLGLAAPRRSEVAVSPNVLKVIEIDKDVLDLV